MLGRGWAARSGLSQGEHIGMLEATPSTRSRVTDDKQPPSGGSAGPKNAAPSEASATELTPRARLYTRLFMGSLVVTLLLYFMSIPFIYFAWISAPATIVFAILSLVASRAQKKITGLRLGLSMGIVLAGLSMVLALGVWVFQDAIIAQRDCMARALTNTAQKQCDDAYDEAYQAELEKFGLTLP